MLFKNTVNVPTYIYNTKATNCKANAKDSCEAKTTRLCLKATWFRGFDILDLHKSIYIVFEKTKSLSAFMSHLRLIANKYNHATDPPWSQQSVPGMMTSSCKVSLLQDKYLFFFFSCHRSDI